MTIKANGKTYDSVEELFEAMEARRPRHHKFVNKFFNGSLLGYAPSYIFFSPHKSLPEVIRSKRQAVKHFWQRGRRGYSDGDVWDMSYYLSRILPEMVKALRENLHSHPMNILDDGLSLTEFDDKAKADPTYSDRCHEAWKDILLKIETGLRVFDENDKMVSADFDSYEDYWAAIQANNAKFQEAWALMGKHFESLWD